MVITFSPFEEFHTKQLDMERVRSIAGNPELSEESVFNFGTFLILLILELTALSIYYLCRGKNVTVPPNKIHTTKNATINISIFRLLNEFLLITVSFFLLNYYKRGTFALSDEYERVLIVVYGVWLVTSFFTRQFEFRNTRNLFTFIAPYLKSFFLMTAIMAVVVFFFRLFYYSRLQIFGTFVLLLFFEAVYNSLYFLDVMNNGSNGARANRGQLKKLLGDLNQSGRILLPYKRRGKSTKNGPSLAQRFKDSSRLTEFVSASLDLSRFENHEICQVNTCDLSRGNGRSRSPKILVNEYRVNDIKRINKYFLQVHRQLKKGCYFAGRLEPLKTYRKQFFNKYPGIIALPLYCLDFAFVRVLPRLSGLNKIYFFLTKGKNRVLTPAEVLGRLYYCGFEVIESKEVHGEVFYLARKAHRPKTDRTPNYGPIIKIERVGLGGNMIFIRKLRTMHPYAEYLQEYVHRTNELAANGKFSSDFRICKYGRVMRQYWLDELPQLINFFRGDLNLVGVRALSPHYFSLYPAELQKRRIKFKPGIIPPYYADLPKSFDEIMESERKYLDSKESHPYTTDIKYFSRAVVNILFRKARSQ